MESVMKRSLAVPIKKLTSCVSGVKEREVWAKGMSKKSEGGRGGGGGGGGRCVRWDQSTPPRTGHINDPSIMRSYQDDLEKERKRREARNAQKNAERAAMRAQFRRKHQLSKSTKDTNHIRAVGGKVALPRELAKLVQSETSSKDDGYNLLNSFQGLTFNMGVITGRKQSKTTTPTSNAEPCKIM